MSAIVDYLSGEDNSESLERAVGETMRRRSARRLQAALADRLACEMCQARLPEYARAQDLGAQLTTDLEQVARHLMHCEECSADYAALQALSHAGEAADLAAIPVPEPDLSFLSPAPSSVAGLWRQVEAAHRQFLADIQVTISRAAAQFGSLPAGLVPQPVPIPVLRDSTAGGQGQRLALPDQLGNVTVELTVNPAAGGAEVALGLSQADTGRPLARAAVTLLNTQGQRLRRADTGPDGRATLGALPPGRYGLQLRTPAGRWELTLVLAGPGPEADA